MNMYYCKHFVVPINNLIEHKFVLKWISDYEIRENHRQLDVPLRLQCQNDK